MRPSALARAAARVQLLAEEATLLASLVKWTLLASVVGFLVGGSTTAFLRLLEVTHRSLHQAAPTWILLPLGFLLARTLQGLAPETAGHGTEKVIEAVHRQWGRIPARVAPVKAAATVLTIAVGGSVGKEGPCAQIGAALASSLASLLRLSRRDRRKLVVCGISAGFATVFGTPLAGSIFGVEVLYLGSVLYDVLYPSLVAGIVGYQVSSRLGVRYFREHVYGVPQVSGTLFFRLVLAGIFFGLVALLLIESLHWASLLINRVPGPPPLVAGAGGLALAGLAALASARYLGLGVETIEAGIRGAWIPPAAFAWKILFTALSLGVGVSGGVVTPIFFVGASAGSTVGHLLGQDRGAFAAIGMVALLAGAANTPLAASIMALEMFGVEVAPLAAVACVVSYVIVGHRSVYPSQILAHAKSASLRVPAGQAVAQAGPVTVAPTVARWLRILRRRSGRR